MTIKMRCDFVDDVSRRNDVLSIAITPTLTLSAAVWTIPVADTLLSARLKCLDYALQRLTRSFPNEQVWLIAAHKTLQPDNRITRHNGLWKSLRKAGVVVPQGDVIGEAVLTSENGIRVFGAIRLGMDQLKAVNSVLTAAQGALVVIPEPKADVTVKLLVRRGWAIRNSKPPEEILEVVCAQSGLVVDIYGDFDDREASVAAVGKSEVFGNLDFKS